MLLRRAHHKRARVSTHEYSFLDYGIARLHCLIDWGERCEVLSTARRAWIANLGSFDCGLLFCVNALTRSKRLPFGGLIDTSSNGGALRRRDARGRGL